MDNENKFATCEDEATSKQVGSRDTPQWQHSILRMTAIALFVTLGCALIFIAWTANTLFTLGALHADDPLYSWTSMAVLANTTMRVLGIFFGAACMFAGAATAFYTAGQSTNITGGGGQSTNAFQFALATASPGIVAIVAGAAVVVLAVYAKSTFQYTPGGRAVPASSSSNVMLSPEELFESRDKAAAKPADSPAKDTQKK